MPEVTEPIVWTVENIDQLDGRSLPTETAYVDDVYLLWEGDGVHGVNEHGTEDMLSCMREHRDETARMLIIDDPSKGRVMVEHIVNMTIRPTSVYETEELECVS